MNYEFMRKKYAKQVIAIIEKQWGMKFDDDFVFINSSGNIYITTREVDNIPFDLLRVNSIGLYIGELKNGTLRLSIEGSQLIGPKASINVVELDDDETSLWMRGFDLNKESDCKGYVILKKGEDYLGCGVSKSGRILNFVPKSRRIKSLDVPK